MCGIHQFVRIGESAMVAAMSGTGQDVAPFVIAQGNHARVIGINRVNLERRGFPKERIQTIDRALRIVFRSGLRPRDAFAKVREELSDSPDAEHIVAFLEKSERGFCRVR
jgi:UDP-N-acetylglucosamine acyltransferase